MKGRLVVHGSNCRGCGSLLDADPGNTYIRGKLVRQTYANGTIWNIRYDVASSGAYATRAVVETPDGVRHEIRTEDFVTRWIRNSGQARG